jgi:glutathione S-transferase
LIELYDHILSDRCYAARLLLGLLGVDYVKRTVDYAPAKTPVSRGVIALNPRGEVPVLVEDGRTHTDLIEILVHLCAHHDVSRAWAPPEAPHVSHWLMFAEGPLRAMHHARNARLFGTPGDLDALTRNARGALRAIEDHLTDQGLAGHDWIVGATPTLADIAVFPSVALSHDAGIGHEDYPAINLWQRRVRRLPGFIAMPGIPDYF